MDQKLRIVVYGREQICASCVGAPGSRDTFEWLQAAIGRKYDQNQFTYEYIDMDHAQPNEDHQKMIEQMGTEDLFYPLIMINDEIIAEGIPHIKSIFQAIETHAIEK